MKKFNKVLALILAVATMFSNVPIPNYAIGGDSFATLEYTAKESSGVVVPSPNAPLEETAAPVLYNDNNYFPLYRDNNTNRGGRVEITGYSGIAIPETITFTYDIVSAFSDYHKTLKIYFYDSGSNTFNAAYTDNPANIIGTYPLVSGSNSVTLDSMAVNKMFAAFDSGKTVAITSDATTEVEAAIYHINFTPNGSQEPADDKTAISPDGSYFVDTIARTISAGTLKITTATTVETFKSKLQIHAEAVAKVTKNIVTDSASFGTAFSEADATNLDSSMRYVVKAEDGTTETYSLIFAENSDGLSTKATHYAVTGTVAEDSTTITSDVTVETFLSNLNKHAAAGWLVAPGTSTFANEAAIRAEIASRTALSKLQTAKLSIGDVLWTVSESGIVRSYPIVVADLNSPVSLLDLTEVVTIPITGVAPNTTAIDTAQYTGTIAWYKDDLVTPAPVKFAANTKYTAVVHLTAKPGFSFSGIPGSSYAHSSATSIVGAVGTGSVEVNFAATAPLVNVNLLNLTTIVPAPVRGAASNVTTVDTAQYSGTISWWDGTGITPAPANFGASKEYIARVELFAKSGYTFANTVASSFTHSAATWIDNAPGFANIQIIFEPTEAEPVSNLTLTSYVPAPVVGNPIVATPVDNTQYTGITVWFESDGVTPANGAYANDTIYKARTTLTPKAGYALTGVAANSFTNTNATVVTNAINSGVVWSTFAKTPSAPDTTPPTFANGYPSISDITHNSVTINTNINEAGSFKFLVKRLDDMIPTNAEFLAQSSSIPITAPQAGSPRSALHTGLTPSTIYKLYYKAIDSAGNATNMLSTVFSTTAAPDTEPPEFAGNSPSISGITQSSATLDVIVLDSGVVEYMVVPSTIPAPDTDSFVAGKSTLTVSMLEACLRKR